MGRAPCCDKNNVKRGPWSPEEDAVLKSYIEKHGHGGNWIALPLKAGLKRCGKSCRLRWLNYLRPDIKHGSFTQEENNTIFSLYEKLGSRWSIIASHLPGRTDNDVKNHWNTKLKRKLMAAKQQVELSTDHSNAPHIDHHHILQSSSQAPQFPPPRPLETKSEIYSHIEEFSKPLQSNYVINNGPYSYYSNGQPSFSAISLKENPQVVSPPLSGEISAASSSVTVDNGCSSNSLINWNGSDITFLSEFSDLFSGYGDIAALGLVYDGVTYS